MADEAPKQTKNWTPTQLKFIQWLATPKSERKPKTQGKFGIENDVHEATLSDWKRIDGFMDEVAKLARFLLKDAVTDIYGALVKRAVKGDVQAIKLAMEMLREYTPRQEVEHSGTLHWGEIVKQGAATDDSEDPFA